MSNSTIPAANRILIIDDNRAIHADFRKILAPQTNSITGTALQAAKSLLFSQPAETSGPGPISYLWTASGGTLSSTTVANPTFACSGPGNASLTLTVSDGDAGCTDTFNLSLTCPPDSAVGAQAWVEIGANSQAIARLITPYTVCPSITVDGVSNAMTVRALPASLPIRTTSTDATLAAATTSGNSKPSVFTTTTCEFLLPAGATTASVAGIELPLPGMVPAKTGRPLEPTVGVRGSNKSPDITKPLLIVKLSPVSC